MPIKDVTPGDADAHYAAALDALGQAEEAALRDDERNTNYHLAAAGVHATLALVCTNYAMVDAG